MRVTVDKMILTRTASPHEADALRVDGAAVGGADLLRGNR